MDGEAWFTVKLRLSLAYLGESLQISMKLSTLV